MLTDCVSEPVLPNATLLTIDWSIENDTDLSYAYNNIELIQWFAVYSREVLLGYQSLRE